MRTTLSLLAASLLVCLSGCGPSYTAPGGTVVNTVTGNWSMATTPTVGPPFQFGGYLQNNSGVITGTLHITNPTGGCFTFNAATSSMPAEPVNIPVTGTLNGSNVLVLTSSAVNSNTLTINGVMNGTNNTLTSGTYSFSGGGCASGDNGSITGNQDSSFTFTYTGSLTSAGSVGAIGISANLLQQGPDVNGLFSVTGFTSSPPAILFTGPGSTTCFTNGIVSNLTVIAGNYVFITLTTNGTPAGTVQLTGTTTSTDKTISGTYQTTAGACNGDSGTFTMTHP